MDPNSRLVAVKVIRSDYANVPDFRKRFKRETNAARRVSGFYTARVLDADADAAQPWLATAYVAGPTLHEVVCQFGVLTEPALRALGVGLAEAVVAIHAAHIVHRDIKPGNVLITENGPLVIDFGLSKAAGVTRLTRTGATLGTPGYMAPEQIVSAHDAGPAADVFSLGCVLVYAATGQGPFGTGTTDEILGRAVNAPPQLAGVPEPLLPLVESCLEKNPEARPTPDAVLRALRATAPSALLTPELRDELELREAHAAALAASPPRPGTRRRTERPGRRRILWMAAGATTAAAAGVAALVARAIGADGATPEQNETTVRPGTSPVPTPEPVWQRSLPSVTDAKSRLLGDNLVYWGEQDAYGFDTESGTQHWQADSEVLAPAGADGDVRWLDVQGAMLFATSYFDHDDYRRTLIGVNSSGQHVFTHEINLPEGEFGWLEVLAASSSVAVIGLGTGGFLTAVDLTSGRELWSHAASHGHDDACIQGNSCYLHNNGMLHSLDLRSGTVRWSVETGTESGTLSTDGTMVFVTSVKVQAFRASDGHSMWSALNQSTTLSGLTVYDNRAYLTDDHTVVALNTADGTPAWSTENDLEPDISGLLDLGPAVTSSLVAVPLPDSGIIALRASDGRVLWARQPSIGGEGWQVQAAGNTVYAASPDTLYAFRSNL
jgi:outer membrane protein assembly factor BamB